MPSSKIRGFAEVVINVEDLTSVQEFYERVVGLKPHSCFPEDDPTIVFLSVAELDSALGRGGHPQILGLIDAKRHLHTRERYAGLDPLRSTFNHLALEIDESDFSAEMERLRSMGVEVTTLDFPHMRAKGMFFKDPEGNLIELICHVRGPSQ